LYLVCNTLFKVEIIVIGIGQSLRSDDGAGLAAVQLWQKTYPASASHPSVQIELVEVPGLSLLDRLLGKKAVILVDAARSGSKPGTLLLIPATNLAAFEAGSASAHGIGVAEILELGQRLYPEEMPMSMVLIGIEAGELGLGDTLSPEVRETLPQAVVWIEEQLQNLLKREIRE
jgi:hydrogenase maturation protease